MLIVDCADVAARATAIAAALAAGVDAVQLRDRAASARTLLAAGTALRAWTRAHGAALLVNDRIDVARTLGADGVHLPAASFPLDVARRLLGPEPLIGRSTHAAAEAEAAAGADYVILGPIFDTPSKRAYGPPLGPAVLAAAGAAPPVVAIGGVTAANAAALVRAGAHGVAVVREVLEASDPAAAGTALIRAITEA